MYNFNIKSLVLGIGIGIIITSIVSIIYLAGVNPNSKIGKEEIIRLAKEYGLVEGTEVLKSQPAAVEQAQPGKVQEKPVDKPSDNPKPQDTVKGEIIKIVINPGDTSETVADKLLKSGLISDKGVFIRELENEGLTTEIAVGEFNIKNGSSLKAVIKAITWNN